MESEVGFNPEQIYHVAKRIEENASAFYRKAAEFVKDPETKKRLLSLAEWEDRHLEFFESLRTDLSDLKPVEYGKYIARLFEPDEETAATIREWADSDLFMPEEHPSERLTGSESVQDILKMALQLEKDALVFYVGLRDAMKATSESDGISKIIREEMRHISVLKKDLDRCEIE